MTPKQERFAQEYMVDMNATAAAKRAGYSEHTAMEQGYQLLRKPSVHAAVQAAQAELRERTKVSAKSVSQQLQEAYDMAERNGQASAMVQAAMGIAKLHGLLVDKVEQRQVAADMTEAELEAESERIQAELDALDESTAH